jgi:hypothetical protein
MSKFEIDIDLDFSTVDLASLETDDDFQREAKNLLPKALVQLGERVGERTWEELQKGMKGQQSQKRKFIQETGRTYQRNASSRERQELQDYIIDKLRHYKRQ